MAGILYEVARELASHLRLKRLDKLLPRKDDGGVARELASHLRLKLPIYGSTLSASLSGEGTGFSSEIETEGKINVWYDPTVVARELASHLRLKPCGCNSSRA